MKKFFEKWKVFVNEAEAFFQWSVEARIKIKKPAGDRAVIEETLTLIRGIEGITVVSSETDEYASSKGEAVVDLRFKFVPTGKNLPVLSDIKKIRAAIFKKAPLVTSVTSASEMLSRRKRVF